MTQLKAKIGVDFSREKSDSTFVSGMNIADLDGIKDGDYFFAMPLAFIAPWSENPRKSFEREGLEELRDSIAVDGVQQAIVVRTTDPAQWIIEPGKQSGVPGFFLFDRRWFQNFGKPDCVYLGPSLFYREREEAEYFAPRFEIVMGERRYRASVMAGLETIPCIVRVGLSDRNALRLAVQENMRRANLNAIEEALSYQALIGAGEAAADLAALLGVSAPTVSNRLRLLKLPQSVREDIAAGKLGVSHALSIAKFAEFPAIAGAIAEIVAEQGIPSHQLEKDLPYGIWQDLQTTGLVKNVRVKEWNDNPTQWAPHCLSCPFNAYRAAGNGSYGYCLKPAHYQELAEQFLQEATEASKADTERLQKAAAASPRLQEKLTKLETDSKDGNGATKPSVLLLEKLDYNSYASIHDYDRCALCTSECPCRTIALDRNNNSVEICIDPARRNSLKGKETREVKKGLRVVNEARLQALANLEKGVLTDIGRRGLAVLAQIAMGSQPFEIRRQVAKSLPQGTPLKAHLEASSWSQSQSELWKVLNETPYSVIVWSAIEALVRKELLDSLESPHNKNNTPVTDFILQDTWRAEAAPQAPEPAAEEKPATFQCPKCECYSFEEGVCARCKPQGSPTQPAAPPESETGLAASRACPLCGENIFQEVCEDTGREEWICVGCAITIPVNDPKGCPTCGEDMYYSWESSDDPQFGKPICPTCGPISEEN